MPSSAAPIAMTMATGRWRNIVANGRRSRRPSATTSRNTGVSSIDQRRYSETSSSGNAMQERDAPAPCRELLGGQGDRHDDEQRRREDRADGGAELRDRRVEGALHRTRVLGREQDRAAPLAAEREALHDAEQHEEDRAEPAGLRVGRQQADEAGGDAHDADGPEQRRATSEPVAHVAEDHGADRPHDERERDRRERGELAAELAERVEEERADEERGEVGEDVEVERLERGADHRRPRDASHGRGVCRDRGGGGGGGHVQSLWVDGVRARRPAGAGVARPSAGSPADGACLGERGAPATRLALILAAGRSRDKQLVRLRLEQ